MVLFSLCSLGHEIAKKTSRVDVEICLTSGDIILNDAQNIAKMHFLQCFQQQPQNQRPPWRQKSKLTKKIHHYVADNVN